MTDSDISILVEFSGAQGLQQASRTTKAIEDLKVKSKEVLDDALDTIVAMAHKTSAIWDKIPVEISQAEIEFGIKLDYEVGVIVSKARTEGSIGVKLTLERKKKPTRRRPRPW